MVCLGNICRSPLAHGILEDKVRRLGLDWEVESAGTSGWHNGEPPDSRSVAVAAENGIDISRQRSRKFFASDFKDFDLIIAMDRSNYKNILSLSPGGDSEKKVKLLMDYAYPGQNREVPDPYYEGGFPAVFDMVGEAVDALVDSHVKR